MGLYPIKCAACGKTFQWFSGSADQRCERCRTRAASALDAYLSAVKALDAQCNGYVTAGKARAARAALDELDRLAAEGGT